MHHATSSSKGGENQNTRFSGSELKDDDLWWNQDHVCPVDDVSDDVEVVEKDLQATNSLATRFIPSLGWRKLLATFVRESYDSSIIHPISGTWVTRHQPDAHHINPKRCSCPTRWSPYFFLIYLMIIHVVGVPCQLMEHLSGVTRATSASL